MTQIELESIGATLNFDNSNTIITAKRNSSITTHEMDVRIIKDVPIGLKSTLDGQYLVKIEASDDFLTNVIHFYTIDDIYTFELSLVKTLEVVLPIDIEETLIFQEISIFSLTIGVISIFNKETNASETCCVDLNTGILSSISTTHSLRSSVFSPTLCIFDAIEDNQPFCAWNPPIDQNSIHLENLAKFPNFNSSYQYTIIRIINVPLCLVHVVNFYDAQDTETLLWDHNTQKKYSFLSSSVFSSAAYQDVAVFICSYSEEGFVYYLFNESCILFVDEPRRECKVHQTVAYRPFSMRQMDTEELFAGRETMQLSVFGSHNLYSGPLCHITRVESREEQLFKIHTNLYSWNNQTLQVWDDSSINIFFIEYPRKFISFRLQNPSFPFLYAHSFFIDYVFENGMRDCPFDRSIAILCDYSQKGQQKGKWLFEYNLDAPTDAPLITKFAYHRRMTRIIGKDICGYITCNENNANETYDVRLMDCVIATLDEWATSCFIDDNRRLVLASGEIIHCLEFEYISRAMITVTKHFTYTFGGPGSFTNHEYYPGVFFWKCYEPVSAKTCVVIINWDDQTVVLGREVPEGIMWIRACLYRVIDEGNGKMNFYKLDPKTDETPVLQFSERAVPEHIENDVHRYLQHQGQIIGDGIIRRWEYSHQSRSVDFMDDVFNDKLHRLKRNGSVPFASYLKSCEIIMIDGPELEMSI
ncbi:hypothetical protein PCE1_002594 [Barthelona sp. PCE]